MTTKRKSPAKASIEAQRNHNHYPGIRGKTVHWADHAFEDEMLYIRVRFTDGTELCWRIGARIAIEEADLCDWSKGD